MFCPKCGSILKPKLRASKPVLYCSCGFSKTPEENEASTKLTEKVNEGKRVEVIEQVETHPKIKMRCEKCNNNVAYYWTQQTRGADEPETRFFKCVKCGYTWREYA